MNGEHFKKISSVLKAKKVKDIMSRFAITTESQMPVTNLAHLLMRFKISGVPVVDSNKEIIGIVTATDLFNKMKKIIGTDDVPQEEQEWEKLLVKDIMITNVFSVSEEDTLFDVIKLMCDENIHTLPVVSDSEIVGIVGRRDIINAFYVRTN